MATDSGPGLIMVPNEDKFLKALEEIMSEETNNEELSGMMQKIMEGIEEINKLLMSVPEEMKEYKRQCDEAINIAGVLNAAIKQSE